MRNKTCAICNVLKSDVEFNKSQFDRKYSICRECLKIYNKEYRCENKNKLKEIRDSKKSLCADCDCLCDKRAIRCKTCSNRLINKNKICSQFYCIDCKSIISDSRKERCSSCEMKNRWSDGYYSNRVSNSIRKSFYLRWSDPIIQQKIIKNLLLSNGSKLEKFVADIASQYGFKNSVVIDKYIVDLVNENEKIIIEVNGDLWHCNPKFWKANDIHPRKNILVSDIWERECYRKKFLESLGYEVYFIWEHDINKGKDNFVIDFIESIINKRLFGL